MRNKLKITGAIVFNTAFHIGSGEEGVALSDRGILRNQFGEPVLPGSTLKGCLRATAEKLAGHLGMSACLLDESLSGTQCLSTMDRQARPREQRNKNGAERYQDVREHTCDICWLFGSPAHGARICVHDGKWIGSTDALFVRHGVVIDRDSGTAVPKLKYDFEVVPGGRSFDIQISVNDPEPGELALLGAAISELQDGFYLGGMKSRGLGAAQLADVKIETVDMSVPEQRNAWLLKRQWQLQNPDYFNKQLETYLADLPGA